MHKLQDSDLPPLTFAPFAAVSGVTFAGHLENAGRQK